MATKGVYVCVCFRSPLAQMEEERREHVMKMKKMEGEMEQVFEMKVKEKKQKLKDSEAEVCVFLLTDHVGKQYDYLDLLCCTVTQVYYPTPCVNKTVNTVRRICHCDEGCYCH